MLLLLWILLLELLRWLPRWLILKFIGWIKEKSTINFRYNYWIFRRFFTRLCLQHRYLNGLCIFNSSSFKAKLSIMILSQKRSNITIEKSCFWECLWWFWSILFWCSISVIGMLNKVVILKIMNKQLSSSQQLKVTTPISSSLFSWAWSLLLSVSLWS